MNDTNKLTYNEAIKELEEIVRKTSSGELNVDELAQKLKRAKELADYCQKRLKSIESDISAIITEDTTTDS